MINDLNDEEFAELYGEGESDIDYATPAVMPEGEAEALDRANWHLKMAARLTRELAEVEAVYKLEMERLQVRLGHRQEKAKRAIAWHEAPVEALHAALLRDAPKRKSIELPHGTSKMKVPATPRITFTDKKAALAWAEKNRPDIIKHDVNVTGIGEAAIKPKTAGNVTDSESGEIIPGVEAVLDPPKWNASYE